MATELVLLASSTLLAEDLTCIAAGALVASGRLGFTEATLACIGGIVAGDLGLYGLGRIMGRRVLTWRLVRSRVTPEQLERASDWLSKRGASVILASRFTPGMRLPVYLAAGALRTNALQFCSWFFIASSVWTPIVVGLSATFGTHAASAGLASAGTISIFATVMGVSIFGVRYLTPRLFTWERRRRIIGRFRRIVRWEFWPVWAAYLPVLPWIAALAFRYRSLTLFTAANPGIETGGFVGESKSRILHALAPSGAVATFRVVQPGSIVESARYPVVFKPDVGERGAGVVIARSQAQLRAALADGHETSILQEYVPGVEFGVFYCRFPNEARGRITSITEKRFPSVAGDGRQTLRQLILSDDRAVCMARVYLDRHAAELDTVPAQDTVVPLVDIGSHCRGAIFVDASHLRTDALSDRIDDVSRTHPGFFFGRYDVRASSPEAFRAGDFKVIELNGVAAEPTHIYDPAVSLFAAYRDLFRHWLTAFRIGAMNRARGARPATFRELVRAICSRRK
jgi:membrane protein DedA with SNARE-associated domain